MLYAVSQHEKVKQACMSRTELEEEDDGKKHKEISEKQLVHL